MCCYAGRNFISVFMSPNLWGGGGHIVFSADPVGGGGGGGVATCLHSLHILAKLTQIYYWEGENAD